MIPWLYSIFTMLALAAVAWVGYRFGVRSEANRTMRPGDYQVIGATLYRKDAHGALRVIGKLEV